MTAPDPNPAAPTILVAEDDDTSRLWLAQALAGAGYAVRTAANGAEALGLLQHGPVFDLIVLDMLMPVLDGWAFLQQFREANPHPVAPILVITATILTREWAQDHGCAGFLPKPLETAPLLIEVGRCLAGLRSGR